jgi:hypothetical protein
MGKRMATVGKAAAGGDLVGRELMERRR